jgi:hypothetical protein
MMLEALKGHVGALIEQLRVEMHVQFEGVNARFEAMDARFDGVDARIDSLRAETGERFDRIEKHLELNGAPRRKRTKRAH